MLLLLRWLSRRPLRLLHAIGAVLGWLVYWASPSYRRRLRDNAQRHRAELQAWIAREGLEDEVRDLGDALAFDLLFVTATPQGAAALNRAPGVVAVRAATDLTGPGSSPGGVALIYG